jgi:hypothetical protein
MSEMLANMMAGSVAAALGQMMINPFDVTMLRY